MKKTSCLVLLSLVFMLFAASCGKDGAAGPQGPQGPQGTSGTNGTNGKDGTTIYSGTTAPATTIGAIGDFYIDLSSGIFYGPKTTSGWGTGFSIKGPAGPAGTNGTNGSVIYSGNTAPSASIGAIGDFYIDLTKKIFYGPKTASGWGAGFSLAPIDIILPAILYTIITPAIYNTLIMHGTVVNGGLTPPALSGIYLLNPNYCLFDNAGSNEAGKTTNAYKYQFSSQNNSNFTIAVNYSDVFSGGTDSGSDAASTYISGSGNLFTVFAETNGTQGGIPYTALQVISGSIGSNGITNFQLTIYLVSKGDDPNNTIIPVGSTRIFEDQDGLSETQTTLSAVRGNQILGLSRNQLNSIIAAKH